MFGIEYELLLTFCPEKSSLCMQTNNNKASYPTEVSKMYTFFFFWSKLWKEIIQVIKAVISQKINHILLIISYLSVGIFPLESNNPMNGHLCFSDKQNFLCLNIQFVVHINHIYNL